MNTHDPFGRLILHDENDRPYVNGGTWTRKRIYLDRRQVKRVTRPGEVRRALWLVGAMGAFYCVFPAITEAILKAMLIWAFTPVR